MLRLIVQRLLLLIPLLLGLSVLLFAWVRALPGGPATALLGERATPEAVARINTLYGFDQPLHIQYFKYLGRLLTGDFGVSTRTGRPVLEEFITRFPATIELTIVALIIAIGIGIPLGYVAARRAGSIIDHSSVVVSLIGVTVPVFFLAFILKYLFAVELGWFPSTGRQDPTMIATHPTNFYVLDGLLTGEWDAAWDALVHMILPGIALLSGAVLTETVFAFSGIGSFLAEAVFNADYPVMQGFVLMIAIVYALVNLFVDVSYGLIDPRLRRQQ
jgi:peptide/nickel transport system permease protein